MRIVHLLRKYNPAEWGGTETAVLRLLEGLRNQGLESTIMAPKLPREPHQDPFRDAGFSVRRFLTFVPVAGISRAQRQQLVGLGGNLMSFDLFRLLQRERGISLVHCHALNRLGAIGRHVAHRRGLPAVATIHGGAIDLPAEVRKQLTVPLEGGFEWGKIFGWWLRSRTLLRDLDAVIACNPTEARLLQEKYPRQRVLMQPHGVPLQAYRVPHRAAAQAAFPNIVGRKLLVVLGRLDPVKNQRWVVEQAPEVVRRHPDVLILLVGPATNADYAENIRREAQSLGLGQALQLTGALPPGDPRLIGLLQSAHALAIPSISETFGLVILEAWACGAAVLSTPTSGALALLRHQENGWIFDLKDPASFHQAVDEALAESGPRDRFAKAGQDLVARDYDIEALATRLRGLYEDLYSARTRR